MKIEANNVEEYISKIDKERKPFFIKLRDTINLSIPKGFNEELNYNMIGWVVPHSIYPKGYHCDPKLPLPFMNIAVQKNFIAFYHMGLYTKPELLEWFKEECQKALPSKLDMGKSCVRFKKPEHIPYKLISQLVKKISIKAWVNLYEDSRNNKRGQC
jgi:hypothetical protein